MSLPDYKSLMLPLLHIAADGETSTRTAMRQLRTTFDLPGARHAPMLRDGRSSILKHRAHWARSTWRAGLIEERQRGVFRATARGRAVLGRNPSTSRRTGRRQSRGATVPRPTSTPRSVRR